MRSRLWQGVTVCMLVCSGAAAQESVPLADHVSLTNAVPGGSRDGLEVAIRQADVRTVVAMNGAPADVIRAGLLGATPSDRRG